MGWTAPEAAFVSNTPVCNDTAAVFTNTSVVGNPPADHFQWAFGDGITSTQEYPTHLYAGPGSYKVVFELCNLVGCDDVTGTVTVLPTPTAAFTFVTDTLTVTFTNVSQDATAYLWAFGDGITSTLEHPVHTYAAAGPHPVTLTAYGCSEDDFTALVTVTANCAPAEIVDVGGAVDGCQVDLLAVVTGTAPFAYLWDLGAFGSYTTAGVALDLVASGSYPYTLTASNCGGTGTDTFTETLVVTCTPPCVDVEILTYMVEIDGCAVDLALEVTGTAPLAYLWAFGDGMTATAALPTHVYTQTGTYSVTADVYNCAAGHDTAAFAVTVDCTVPPPVYRIYLPLVSANR
jgi:PKD repeat protein